MKVAEPCLSLCQLARKYDKFTTLYILWSLAWFNA